MRRKNLSDSTTGYRRLKGERMMHWIPQKLISVRCCCCCCGYFGQPCVERTSNNRYIGCYGCYLPTTYSDHTWIRDRRWNRSRQKDSGVLYRSLARALHLKLAFVTVRFYLSSRKGHRIIVVPNGYRSAAATAYYGAHTRQLLLLLLS